MEDGRLSPVMNESLCAPEALLQLVKCACLKNICAASCKCRSNNLPCTEMCECNSDDNLCDNVAERCDGHEDSSDNSDDDE